MAYWNDWSSFPRTLSVAARKAMAQRELKKLQKEGRAPSPVVIEGRTIARTLWGKAWCENLERYSDYENRLPRGRSYVRNGSVIDLAIACGEVCALVQGNDLYRVEVNVDPLTTPAWSAIVDECAGKIDSLVDLLRGRVSPAVMAVVTRREGGLFPKPSEIHVSCSCPDWAVLCKHVCAVLYGIGARFDRKPEMLFRLRGTDPTELIAAAASSDAGARHGSADVLAETDLADLFGIEIDGAAPDDAAPRTAELEPRTARPKRAKPNKGREEKRNARAGSTRTRAELIAIGVPRGTISTWARTGVLRATRERGVYKLTPEARARLEHYGR